jgi:hypothetical protein
MTGKRETREAPAWLTISVGTTVLMAGMLVVMWVQQGPAICVAAAVPRTLRLDRVVDRDHLAADTAAATRMARRYMATGASAEERLQRFVECDARLVSAIAAAHGMTADEVRATYIARE